MDSHSCSCQQHASEPLQANFTTTSQKINSLRFDFCCQAVMKALLGCSYQMTCLLPVCIAVMAGLLGPVRLHSLMSLLCCLCVGSASTEQTGAHSGRHHLSGGAIAGVVVGAVAACVLAAVLGSLLFRRCTGAGHTTTGSHG